MPEDSVKEKVEYIKFCNSVLGYVDDETEMCNMQDAIYSTIEELKERGYYYDITSDTLTKMN